MTIMFGSLYRDLKAGNVPEDLAQKEAEEVANFQNQFAAIRSDLTLLKWMIGVQFAGVAALVLKSFKLGRAWDLRLP